ncbi:OLC1v1024291C1 [Oldenlandia corymbosa var. corymbosa]|uniref:OLC1v1024291C1 n=1 Tax=Oldenlandia corymbosa var. corymbosa TaxID=529605 RepID=A0AAV1C3D9_OLDCO|nr:OLC1v1024291C1 [Oldenlandia corymbosa var. corymbosa]
MGCVASSIDKEDRVRACKERKRILKHLLVVRKQFADSQLAYLKALRNTGVTLRQFTESESLELEDAALGPALPPSPPPPLPPSPPPPPNFSPDLRSPVHKNSLRPSPEEIIDIDEDGCPTPPPPVLSTSWEYWDPFGSSSVLCDPKGNRLEEEQFEDENWEEANSEFVEEEEEQVDDVAANDTVNTSTTRILEKKQTVDMADDSSSVLSWHTKDTSDLAMVIWSGKKTLSGIVRDLDDYFVKASGGGKDVAVFLDISATDNTFSQSSQDNKRKRNNSSKVFSALTWSWSSKSLHSTREAVDATCATEPCKPGAHCLTLTKLYDAEQKLYKEVKEEAYTKAEQERKLSILQKLEQEDHDWTKINKTRSVVESLQSDILSLEESIKRTCSTILKLIEDELHPQLIALTSGLKSMWRRMYECHQVQNHIAEQLNHLVNQQSAEPTTEYHRHAASQLKTEVTSWHTSLCKLIKSQREFVNTFSKWIQLTESLVVGQGSTTSSAVHKLCEQWLLSFDKLPDKMALEAINSLLSAVQSIIAQQEEEVHMYKRSNKLERRLQKEMDSLVEMEMKFEGGGFSNEETQSHLDPKHPLSVKRAKIEVLKNHVEDEKSKYNNSVKVTRTMILSSLKTSLPNVFRALTAYSSAYSQSLDLVLSCETGAEPRD